LWAAPADIDNPRPVPASLTKARRTLSARYRLRGCAGIGYTLGEAIG